MRTRKTFAVVLTATILGTLGCASSAVRILNLIGLSERPLVVLHVAAPQSDPGEGAVVKLIDPFAPYRAIRKALGSDLHRNVVPELCFSFQVEPSLRVGTSHLAVVSPLDYARLSNRDDFPIVAVPVDRSGQIARPAMLVVKDSGPIESVANLAAQRVTFGPVDHPRTHIAALALLKANGVSKKDLSLELLPVPGTLRHRDTGAEVARDIVSGATAAGFVDAAEWDALPETSTDKQVGRDQLRILAETEVVPFRLIIASPTLDAKTVVAVRDFFLRAATDHADALPGHLAGFSAVEPDQVAAWMNVVRPTTVQTSGVVFVQDQVIVD